MRLDNSDNFQEKLYINIDGMSREMKGLLEETTLPYNNYYQKTIRGKLYATSQTSKGLPDSRTG